MKRTLIFGILLAPIGCGAATTSYVESDTTLGRVIVYRNGVAYFERSAKVDSNELNLSVPADKVDDFLKSLTVIDAKTGKPTPVAYPTKVPSSETGLMKMTIQLQGHAPHELKLSYVTEAPSWKPSYRAVLDKDGKVRIEAWAIIDNTSGEDWNNVRLGVGSSSALSFRYDLRSVRFVQRETLSPESLFALAPPTGGSTYGGVAANNRVMFEFSDDALKKEEAEQTISIKDIPLKSESKHPSSTSSGYGSGRSKALPAPPMQMSPNNQIQQMASALRTSSNQVMVEGFADEKDTDPYAASLDRANKMRDQLIQNGVDPNRVVAIGQGGKKGQKAGVRIVEAPQSQTTSSLNNETKPNSDTATPQDPIGTSHFESPSAMTVPRGTSAMVSIFQGSTEGEVVYYYDPETLRGNKSFPFRAVRIKNPTDSALESGPVTVFGEGRFIGEGLCDPIAARSVAFVPFALDRQIIVEEKESERDEIARVITVQRGVFSTEVKHTRRTTLTFHNRMNQRATVYFRHTVAKGYTLAKAPEPQEKIGNAHLLRIVVEPNSKSEIAVEENTPLFKTTDIRTAAGMELVRVYLSSSAEGQLKAAVEQLLKLQTEIANLEQQITTKREQMDEYRARMDEIHAQIFTLRAVKSGGTLMQNLEKKLQEVSEKISKGTIDIVALQEKLMLTRIRFQDGVAEISLEKKDSSESSKGS